VIFGLHLWSQTNDPDSIHRLRELNPNTVILPYRLFEGQTTETPPIGINIDLDYQLLESTPSQWKATDTAGNVIYAPGFPGLFYMNLSDYEPVVNGQTWRTALLKFVVYL
jgi:hypothetical protein